MRPLDVAQQALRHVSSADGAQATVTVERSLMLRFARSRPTQATAIDDLDVVIAAIRDGHVAAASTNSTDDDGLAACAKAAVSAAEAAAASGRAGAYPGLPGPATPRPHDGHDPDTARLSPASAGEALAVVFGVAERQGVEAHGIWTAGEVETAIASTTGVALHDRVTDAFMKVTAIAPGGRSGWASQSGVAAAALKPAALAARATLKALGLAAPSPEVVAEAAEGRRHALPALEPTGLPPGEHPVVLERHAVAEILRMLGYSAFNGLEYAEGRSALCGRLGTRVAAARVSLSDSPRFPSTLPRAFDAEGVPKSPVPLVQDGVAHRVVHDVRSASLAGAESTGHATAPGGSAWGPAPTNLVMAGGGAGDPAELCRGIDRGVYVTRLWYVNPVRPAETLMTGVTRDGTFLIEDGEVTRPLADMRLTDSFLGLLDRVEELTAAAELTSEGELYGRRFATGVVCPSLRASAMRFTA